MREKIKCRFCGSTNIIKWCKRKTQNRSLIQRYKCKSCRKYFTIDDGFFRMRNNPKKITLCIDLFYKGISTRQIQEHLQAFYPKNSSWVSIYSWIKKYSMIISKFTDNLKLQVGKEIQIDEREFKTKGKRSWFIDCIDTKTRFMVSSNFSQTREKIEIKKVIKQARDKTGKQIEQVTTDGYLLYPKAVKKTFGYNLKLNKYNINHKVINASQGEGFNHPIERLHNSIRQRTKTFRGFKNINSAYAIMNGYEIYYNFIRKHQAINKRPYELAVPNLELGINKWLDLIELSKKNGN